MNDPLPEEIIDLHLTSLKPAVAAQVLAELRQIPALADALLTAARAATARLPEPQLPGGQEGAALPGQLREWAALSLVRQALEVAATPGTVMLQDPPELERYAAWELIGAQASREAVAVCPTGMAALVLVCGYPQEQGRYTRAHLALQAAQTARLENGGE